METKFIFSNTLEWNSGYQATMSFEDKASFGFATPPEFRGPEGFVSPDHVHQRQRKPASTSSPTSPAQKGRLKRWRGR